MNKVYSIKNIVSKVAFVLGILLISIFLISCSPEDKDIGNDQPQNLVDLGNQEDKEEPENKEGQVVEEEPIQYIVENPLMTYIKEDGLYFSYLDSVEETRMHEGGDFRNPRISPDGNFIVYTFEDDLYAYNLEVKDYALIQEDIVSYAFADEVTLIYSGSNKGLTKFNLLDGDKTHEADDNIYENLTYAKKNLLYGKRVLEWSDNQGQYASNVGIVEINTDSLEIKLVIEAIRDSEEELGYDPTIFNISKDGRYLYIMEKFQSGSMSADFGSLGVYDTELKEHTKFEDIYEDKAWESDELIVLPRQNNLTINPQKGNIVSVIKGGGREMFYDKEVVILDIEEDMSYKFIRFMDEGLVAMTPSFSLDGKKLYYSATQALNASDYVDNNNEFETWFAQSHNIYEYDMETNKIEKLTHESSIDITPISMGDYIIFLKAQDYVPEYFSLIKMTDGEEEILLEDLVFIDGFYGNIHTGTSMDILLNSKRY